jgi:hypothetical protein
VGYNAKFTLDSFDHLDDMSKVAMMKALTEALIQVDMAFLLMNHVPRIYESGVRYEMPPRQGTVVQAWRDVPALLFAGCGTCMELVAWRAAEMRMFQGLKAIPLITAKSMQGGTMFHAKIQDLNSGQTEDPSTLLGMGNNEWLPFSR